MGLLGGGHVKVSIRLMSWKWKVTRNSNCMIDCSNLNSFHGIIIVILIKFISWYYELSVVPTTWYPICHMIQNCLFPCLVTVLWLVIWQRIFTSFAGHSCLSFNIIGLRHDSEFWQEYNDKKNVLNGFPC